MKKFLILPFVLVAGNWCRRCGVLKIRHRMSDFELGKALIILLVLLVGAWLSLALVPLLGVG